MCLYIYMYLYIYVYMLLDIVRQRIPCILRSIYMHQCIYRPRMEKSHSKRHELSFYGLVSILIVLIAP